MKYIKQQRSRRTQPGSICPTGGKQTAQKRATGSTRAARLVQAVGHRRPQSPPSQWRRPLYAPPDSPCSCGKSAQIANGCSGPKPRATINMCKPSDSGSDAPLLCHALHINGRKGPRRANIFARAAARAALCIHHGFFWGILRPYQIDHARRANLGAGRAGYLVCHRYAAVKVDHGPPDLRGAFLRRGNGPYGASGANIGTGNAVDPAKQATQRLVSTVWAVASIQPDLQTFSHRPQFLHALSSMRGCSSANLLKKPRKVPTGHTAVHHKRPLRHASTPMMARVATADASAASPFCHTIAGATS